MNQHTLHPPLPFVGLVAIEKSKVFVTSSNCRQSSRERSQTQEAERPWIELLVFFEPQSCPVRKINYAYKSTEDHRWKILFVHNPTFGNCAGVRLCRNEFDAMLLTGAIHDSGTTQQQVGKHN